MEELITIDKLTLGNAVKRLNSALNMVVACNRSNLILEKEILRIPNERQKKES